MITNCRACGSPRRQIGLSLGTQRLSDFRTDASPSPAYPLDLVRCADCTLVQLGETVPRELLYTGNYGYRSAVNEAIRADLASVVETALAYASARARTWLDIASNDGTLLSNVPSRFIRTGVDPVAKFADSAREHADRLVIGFFDPAQFGPQSMDVVTSVSMFYDLDDPNEFVAGVAEILAPAGVWVIQQNYLLDMMQRTTFDNVCHEHITYWSLRPLVALLDRHGLEVVSVTRSPVNGGCIRTVVSRKGLRLVDRSVSDLLREEDAAGLTEGRLFRAFEDQAREKIAALRDFVAREYEAGRTFMIYAASTRGAVIWQGAGLAGAVTAAVERQPEKVGRWFSPLGVPIISEAQARRERPDYLLVGPYWFRDQIIEREADYLAAGGKLVFPLPELEIVG